MQLLDICLVTIYFQFRDKFCQKKLGKEMGNSLPPVASKIYMKHFEEMALDTADHKPGKLLRYIDNIL
jgi:hypothetical protein